VKRRGGTPPINIAVAKGCSILFNDERY